MSGKDNENTGGQPPNQKAPDPVTGEVKEQATSREPLAESHEDLRTDTSLKLSADTTFDTTGSGGKTSAPIEPKDAVPDINDLYGNESTSLRLSADTEEDAALKKMLAKGSDPKLVESGLLPSAQFSQDLDKLPAQDPEAKIKNTIGRMRDAAGGEPVKELERAGGEQLIAFKGEPAALVDGGQQQGKPVEPVDKAAQPQDKPVEPTDKAAQPAEKAIDLSTLPKLQGEELERAQVLQAELVRNLLPNITPIKEGTRFDDHQKELAEQRRQILAESEAGVFGPATQKAFKNFIGWYEQGAIPGTIARMASMGLEVPPGSPFELPLNPNKRTINPDLFKQEVALGHAKFTSGLDSTKVPNRDQLDTMQKGLDWLSNCNRSHDAAVLDQQKSQLTDIIKKEGLPSGWLEGKDQNPTGWVQSAAEMVDLARRTKNYTEAMHSLYKGSTHKDFPMGLPHNTEITVSLSDKQYTIKADDINNPESKRILGDRHSTIASVRLDLPKDLRQDTPTNASKIDRMRQWLDKHGDTIEATLSRDLEYREHPERVIFYGDQELADDEKVDLQGRFNHKNELLGLANAKSYQATPGEHLKEMNLLAYDFSVTKTDDGQFLVDQNIQGWQMKPWAYQNIRAFGDKVGEPIAFGKPVPENFQNDYKSFEIKVGGQARTLYRHKDDPKGPAYQIVGERQDRALKEVKLYGADDFVPIKNGSRMEIMKASKLDDFKTTSKIFYYGEKGLSVGMDGLMLADAVVGTHGVLAASRVGATTAAKLTAREATLQLSKNLAKGTVAGLGVFTSSAGTKQYEFGRTLNTARGLYFMGDISQGLLRGGYGYIRGGKAAETLTAGEKVHSVIYGAEANKLALGAEALPGLGWVKHAQTATHYGFKTTEALFMPVIGRDLMHQVKEIKELGSRDPLKDANIQIGDGRGLQKSEKGSFDNKDPKKLEGTERVLQGHSEALKDGRPPETQTKVQEIMDRTKKMLGPDATDAQREAFRKELLQTLTFTPAELVELEKARPAKLSADGGKPDEKDYYKQIRLTNEDLHKLLSPETRKDVQPPEVRNLAASILDNRDKDVKAASMIALMYVSRDRDGTIADQLAKVSLEVPEYKRKVDETTTNPRSGNVTTSTREITVDARTAESHLDSAEAVKLMKMDLESGSLGNRGIALGDTMVRIGAMSHRQYASLLQDVLKNEKASPADKMRALTDPSSARFATIIDGVRYEEDQERRNEMSGTDHLRNLGESFGLSSKELLATLDATVNNPKEDRDVRAMAAVLQYGLNEPDVRRRTEILDSANNNWQSIGRFASGTDKTAEAGVFAKNVTELLIRDMTSPAEGDQRQQDWIKDHRLNAALVLAKITDATNAPAQKEINEAIANSLSGTSYDVTQKAVDMLLPDRIKQIEADNPKLAAAVRANVLDMIKTPQDFEQERGIANLLQKTPALFTFDKNKAIADPTKKSQATELTDRLSIMLNPQSGSTSIQYYPDMKIQAINALADFGVQDAKNAIRFHLGASGEITLGGRPIKQQETDARVRQAAVDALMRLRDTELPSVVPDLIDREKDSRVASRLRDVKFQTEIIEPTSRQYDEIKEKTTEQLDFATKYKHLQNFDYQDFLANYPHGSGDKAFDLLDHARYVQRSNDAARGDIGISRFWSMASTEALAEQKLVHELMDKRWEQWKALGNMARQEGVDGDKARKSLEMILRKNGAPLGAHGLTTKIEGDKYHRTYYNFDFEEFAARSLRDAAAAGNGGRELTASIIRGALAHGNDLNPTTKNTLLDGLKKLRSEDGKNPPAISQRQYAQTLAEALNAELGMTGGQNETYQQRLIKELREANHRKVFPIFDAMAGRSMFPGVKADAKTLVEDLRDSVALMWDQTSVDNKGTPEDRAAKIKNALEGKKTGLGADGTAEAIVQDMFNTYKGHTIGPKDPGLDYLYMAMRADNERVRLAAAKIVIEGTVPSRKITDGTFPANSLILDKAIETFRDIGANGTRGGYKKDALAELKRLNLVPAVTASK